MMKNFLLVILILCAQVIARAQTNNPPTRLDLAGGTIRIETTGGLRLDPKPGFGIGLRSTCPGAPLSIPGDMRFCYDSVGGVVKLSTNGGAYLNWSNPGAGPGTVTSIGVAVPSFMNVSPAAITTSGTFTFSFNSQAANMALLSPDGAPGSPSFRLLVANDIPALPFSKMIGTLPQTQGGTGLTSFAFGDLIYADASALLARLGGNTTITKKFLTQTGNGTISGAPAWGSIAAGDVPAINLAAGAINGGVAGVLPIANGGLGLSSLGSANNVLGINNAGNGYEPKSFVAGGNISITHGVGSITIAATGTLSGAFRASSGSAAAPEGFTFTSDLDTGVWNPGDGQLGVSTNGVNRATFSSSGLTINSGSFIGNLIGTASSDLPLTGGTLTGALTNSTGSSATSGTANVHSLTGTFNPSATSTMVVQPFFINPTINFSNATPGAGSYEALRIKVLETALPTGTNYLIRASAGAAGTTDKFTVTNGGNVANSGTIISTGNITAPVLVSNVATGTAPLTVTSTTQVANLNAQYVGGNLASAFMLTSGGTFSGRVTFTPATGNTAFDIAHPDVVVDSTSATNDILRIYNTGNGTTYRHSFRAGISSGVTANFLDVYIASGANTQIKMLHMVGDGSVAWANGATITSAGVYTNGSSQDLKENAKDTNKAALMSQINQLPIWLYNYIVREENQEGQKATRIGAFAADFYRIFGFGINNKTIAPSDVAFLSLAGVQALSDENAALRTRVAFLETKQAALERRLATLETAIQPK